MPKLLRLASRDAIAFQVHALALNDITKPGACVPLRREGLAVGMTIACPCGCGQRHMIFYRGRGPGDSYPEWDLTNDWPRITLRQELAILPKLADGRFHWRGTLCNGVFTEG